MNTRIESPTAFLTWEKIFVSPNRVGVLPTVKPRDLSVPVSCSFSKRQNCFDQSSQHCDLVKRGNYGYLERSILYFENNRTACNIFPCTVFSSCKYAYLLLQQMPWGHVFQYLCKTVGSNVLCDFRGKYSLYCWQERCFCLFKIIVDLALLYCN